MEMATKRDFEAHISRAIESQRNTEWVDGP